MKFREAKLQGIIVKHSFDLHQGPGKLTGRQASYDH